MGVVPSIEFFGQMANPATCIDIGLSRSPNGFFKPLLDPGGRFRSGTAVV
jgi:hypothetical protein